MRNAFTLVMAMLVLTCSPAPEPEQRNQGDELIILAGSENETLEPIVAEFAAARGARIEMRYLGSVDIGLALEAGPAIEADAVWPANSLWLALGDQQRVLRHAASIMRSPVIFGVRTSVAQRLGWIARSDVTIEEILQAVEAGSLRFAMTSATQSNSGASAYFGFLHALAGSPAVVTADHLADPELRSKVRRLLAGVERSSGSSGWLKDLYLERSDLLDAMVNYEALVIEANRDLVARGKEPLYAVYPADGLTIADSPLAYVDRGDPAKEELFLALRDHLLSTAVQEKLLASGRRAGLLGLDPGASGGAFDRAWGLDAARTISPVPLPAESVLREALDLYQTVLRKPSITAYVLDFSGSMEGEGERAVKQAMATLLDPEAARRHLLQPSAEDITLVIPFDGDPREVWEVVGNDPAALNQLRLQVERLEAGGGTDLYSAVGLAFERLSAYGELLERSFPAIIVLSDGKSKDRSARLEAVRERLEIGRDVPIFAISFGEADERQLEALAASSSARVFDGRRDLVKAFRAAKGYN
jgi:Ca-activated chloride channel family protein